MSKDEIKYEINKVLDHFSDQALEDLLNFLKEFDSKKEANKSFTAPLDQILKEDANLLSRLAQ
jgi:hypothetical protein